MLAYSRSDQECHIVVPRLSLAQYRWLFLLCALAVLVLALLPPSIPEPTTGWDKTNHLLAFGVLATLGVRAWPGRAWRLVAALIAYGGLIEILQSMTSYRDASWSDLLADTMGIAAGLLLSYRAIRA